MPLALYTNIEDAPLKFSSTREGVTLLGKTTVCAQG